ncbi:hypothetical protein [Wenzhouxiangella sp. XN201]|uniref:sulfotransferase-like domain-containing protein n=1 Tax=Wenzhouxiangella sp. XN201 TaxID=2710755 RepID=UPI001969E5BA|nr:hypothetical protein [Wenzhouxiangella sp. XN201]
MAGTEPLRIAMWSGPRNISTAMMRAFENRPDCTVSDEPLYGAWLKMSGEPHPMREQVIASMDTDWRSVVETLTGPTPDEARVWYQKHMTHHILPEMMETGWLSKLTHVFLIRDPRHVVASYLDKRDTVSPEDIGVPQQQAIYDFIVGRVGQQPPIIDSTEFLAEPEGHLRALCQRIGIEFRPEMMSWPSGPRETDGVWAPHWYQKVWESTGFGPPPNDLPEFEGRARAVAESCQPLYRQLYARRLRP